MATTAGMLPIRGLEGVYDDRERRFKLALLGARVGLVKALPYVPYRVKSTLDGLLASARRQRQKPLPTFAEVLTRACAREPGGVVSACFIALDVARGFGR